MSMSTADWWIIALIAVLFSTSILLAIAETAFVHMNRIRALALADEGRRGAKRLAQMLEHPERTLNTVLLLVLVTQLSTATLVGVLVEARAGAVGVAISIAVQIVIFFVVGEVMPKTYAVQHTERAALFLSRPLWLLTNLPPLRSVSGWLISIANVVLPGRGLKQGPFVTEEEIRAMANVAAAEESIEMEESELIHSIFEFGDTVVGEVMTPRTDIVWLEPDATMDHALEVAIEKGLSRFPVCQGSTDDVIGIVFLKDLMREAQNGGGALTVRAVMRPATFVPEQKRVAELLREMQEKLFHMAVVVDEYGGVAGLVTLEDLLEEIVGDITDEYDVAEPVIERIDPRTLRVPGRTDIEDVSAQLGVELPRTQWNTVSGLVFNLMGKVPYVGEQVVFQGCTFTAEKVQGRRIVSVVIQAPEQVEPSEPARETSDSSDS